MGYISAMFAARVADVAVTDTDSRRSLYRLVGVDGTTSTDPDKTVRDSVFFDLLEHIASHVDHGRSIAIRVGASMRCDDYGAFGLAFKSAVNLAGSFQRVERYGKVVTSIANFVVEPTANGAFMAVRPGNEPRLGLCMTNELAVAAATALSREVSQQEFVPAEICFTHPAPADTSAAAGHFRCPVHYSAERDGLQIGEDLLRAGNRLGDARISEFFDAHLDKALEVRHFTPSLEERVRIEITQALSAGVPKIADVAGRLDMSRRTLQRRLAADGHVYQELVDKARRELAGRLLGNTEFALAEVAFLTGYSEQSTFSRAFKRWYRQTPAGYRRSASTD